MTDRSGASMLVHGMLARLTPLPFTRGISCPFSHSLVKQAINVGQGAEPWIDTAIVGNVIAEVRHRRRIDRGNPQSFYPKLQQIIEPRKNAREISDAVIVRILKRSRINLIDNPALPPGGFLHLTIFAHF